MNKVIFIDIDGTLRNDERKMPNKNIYAIQKIKKLGYEIVLCTGRPADYASKVNELGEIGRYIIFNSGSGIIDTVNNKIIYENKIDKNSILMLQDIANVNGVRFVLSSNGTNYVDSNKCSDMENLLEESIQDFLNKNKVVQVTITSNDFDLIKDMENHINDVPNIKIINRSKSLINNNFPKTGTIYYDVVSNLSSKGNAVKYFCDKFNINKEDTIAIGDSDNDISMFRECNYSVAMDNAIDELKNIASYVTNCNNNDGVAEFLDKLYNEKENK